jgi:hypothetical protein
MDTKFQALYDAVQKRPRPEDVAALIEEVLPLTSAEAAKLGKASRHSFKKQANAYSSMAADFMRPVGAEKQVKTAAIVFSKHTITPETFEPLTAVECMDPETVQGFVGRLGKVISKAYGDRTHLTKAQRREAGIFKCQRWYNKRFRILCHLEEKITKLAWNVRKYEFTRVGKSALATKIQAEDFAANLPTACLVAYLSARMSMRSVFTNQSQERAFDEIAEMLLKKCEQDPGARWDVVAHVMPTDSILKRLNEEQKGRLLGAWWALLTDMADMLKEVARTSNLNRATMIVTRGNDSSTWNQVAGGWNKAREHWVSLLHALGAEGMLNDVCPGKVMRLMAADVAYWHQRSGGGVHPDTKVWADLPAPWEVVRGEKLCTRAYVEMVCQTHGVDPEKWTGCKKDQKSVEFRPTPELVHGVAVSNPWLAAALRKGGVFSGKGIKGEIPPFEVERQDGFATGARPAGV